MKVTISQLRGMVEEALLEKKKKRKKKAGGKKDACYHKGESHVMMCGLLHYASGALVKCP